MTTVYPMQSNSSDCSNLMTRASSFVYSNIQLILEP